MKTVFCYTIKYQKKEYHFKVWAKGLEEGRIIVQDVWNNFEFEDIMPTNRREVCAYEIEFLGKFDNTTSSHVMFLDGISTDSGKYSELSNGISMAIRALEDGGAT